MKKGIHPKYETAKVICACGTTWQTKSTRPEIKVELCSKCHPLFTGAELLIDSAGQVDKFQKRMAMSSAMKEKKAKKKAGDNTPEQTTTPENK